MNVVEKPKLVRRSAGTVISIAQEHAHYLKTIAEFFKTHFGFIPNPNQCVEYAVHLVHTTGAKELPAPVLPHRSKALGFDQYSIAISPATLATVRQLNVKYGLKTTETVVAAIVLASIAVRQSSRLALAQKAN